MTAKLFRLDFLLRVAASCNICVNVLGEGACKPQSEYIMYGWWSPHGRYSMEKRRLSRLSLVCSHWSKRCRPLIFSHITIDTLEHAQRLFAILTSPVSAWLCEHIKFLTLFNKRSFHRPMWIAIVRLVFGSLQSLRLESHVHLQMEDMGPCLSWRDFARLSMCPVLRKLDIHMSSFPSLVTFLRLLRRIPRLEEVTLHRVEFRSPGRYNQAEDVPECDGGLEHIRLAEVSYVREPWIFGWIVLGRCFGMKHNYRKQSPTASDNVEAHSVARLIRHLWEAVYYPSKYRRDLRYQVEGVYHESVSSDAKTYLCKYS